MSVTKMSHVNNKRVRIWIIVKRLDLEERGCDSKKTGQQVTDLVFDTSNTHEDMMNILRTQLDLNEDLVLKLRNHRGSLIPINSSIASNKKYAPYVLEVVKLYQHVTPKKRSVKHCRQVDALLLAYSSIKSRLEHTEAAMPNMMNKRQEKLISEVKEMEKTLDFLKKRLQMAEDTRWQGMFTKCPFW